MSDLEVQAVIGAVNMYALDWLKTKPAYQKFATAVPLANKYVYRVTSAVLAFGSTLGVQVSGTFASGLTLSLPPGAVLKQAVMSFVIQQVLFDLKSGNTNVQK